MSNFTTSSITTRSYPYDQYAGHLVETALVGGANNTAYLIHAAAVPCQVFALQVTIMTADANTTGNLTCYHISANNGSNTYSNTAIGNVIVVGANTVGNTFTSGPFTYNASATPQFTAGGVSLNVGDMIIMETGSTIAGMFACALEYCISPGATLTA